jgi:hypothetical protein
MKGGPLRSERECFMPTHLKPQSAARVPQGRAASAWRLGQACVMAGLLAGCATTGTLPASPEDAVSTALNYNKPTLINEGGPVFALPGALQMPSYYGGDIASLTVRAERIDGGGFPKVPEVKVQKDGTFSLNGPLTSNLFFASTEFIHEDTLHRVRALVRAQSDEPVIIDAASSLMAAKVAMAAQRRKLFNVDYNETTRLTSQVRAVASTELAGLRLDQANEELSTALDRAVANDTSLREGLAHWEAGLLPSPTPSATPPASVTPTPDPSPTPSAAPTPDTTVK